jgi:Flp pilus assembly protein TadG
VSAGFRSRSEHGAALVEFVVVMPLLVLIAFGTIEFGAAWSNKLKVETAARAGARVGSNLGNARLADWGLLQSVRSAIQDIGMENVDYVVVYKASATNGAVPASCKTSPPTPQTGLCNVYTGQQLGSLTQSDFTGTVSCATTAPDRFWCPLSRQDVQHLNPDYIGVWIIAASPTVTDMFGSPLRLQASAVMRLEPA